MDEHHVPKGVSLETLREILTGWATVGAADEPQYTAAVEEATGISDAVGRQNRFLEEVGLLERAGQKHRLTDQGEGLAGALVAGETDVAANRAREVLSEWELAEAVCGVVRANPTPQDPLVRVVAGLAGQDPAEDRVATGARTLLDLFEWASLIERDPEGHYRLPEADADGTAVGVTELTRALEFDGEGSSHSASESTLDGSHAISLAVDVDANPDELESLVAAVRRGLVEDS